MKIFIESEDLKQAMNACKTHVYKEQSRPILSKICIRVYYDNNVEITALDGYTTSTYYCKCSQVGGYVGDHYDFLIDPVTVPKGCKVVTIEDDETTIRISYDSSSFELQVKEKDWKYIDYVRIMKTEKPTMQICVNPKLLERALHSCRCENSVILNIYDSLKPIQIDGYNIRCIVLPMRNFNEDKLNIATTRHETHE